VELTFVELAKTALSLADDEEVRSLPHLQGIITVSLQYYSAKWRCKFYKMISYSDSPVVFSQNLLSNPRHLEYH